MSKTAGLAKTNHPYIMKSPDICSGSPFLTGTRTRVIDIILEYTMLGKSPDEIVDSHPYLNLAKVNDALSYYYENREDMDTEILERIKDIEDLKSRFKSKL
ncbi:DUF433 domain-containing protein [Candidatus Poribacteria bacterium]|nr:DUF433 domain-containing protein [Candidatus Poribacteria bacterium]